MEDKRFLFEEDSVPHALWVMAMPAIATMLSNLTVLAYFIITYRKAGAETILRVRMQG